MRLDLAITKAWGDVPWAQLPPSPSVRFLADEFLVDLAGRQVLKRPQKVLADDCSALLILHYLARKAVGLPALTGEWLSLSQLSVAVEFVDVFKRRATDAIARKHGGDPEGIYRSLERVPGKKLDKADAAVVLEVFEGIPASIELWQADEDFPAEANLLFDSSITDILPVEDVIVLAEVVATSI